MRYIHIIIVALAMMSISACALDNLELPTSGIKEYDEITIIGRTTRFDDYNVDTRAAKQDGEVTITSYAVAIFEVNDDNSIGLCKYYKHDPNASQILLTISRHDDNNQLIYSSGERYAIYVFANMPGMAVFEEYLKNGNTANCTLDKMLEKAYSVSGTITVPENDGFPMIGSIGDTFSEKIDQDGNELILYSDLEDNPPTVNGEPISTLNIPMDAMFAKINFEIEVRPDQIVSGSDYTPQFTFNSYTVNNIPSSVDFDNTTNVGIINGDNVFSKTITSISGNRVASGANKIKFTFYLPENLLKPNTEAIDYQYPFGKGASIREEDEKYRQRYKGKLLGDKQAATNIVISGEFRDHQSHSVQVDYTIHLGGDNYSNFDIKRNGEYNNYITIRGILNDGNNIKDNDNYISIDHRVNVYHKEPAIISLRREVLLDSHYEVRPLRIRQNTANTTATHAKVEVVDANWIRLEQSFGDGTLDSETPNIYINEGVSEGKRQYFTHNLITGENAEAGDYPLVNSTSVTVPINNTEQCVWIYVDECIEAGDDVRSGTIRVSFYKGNDQVSESIDYVFNQRMLYPVTYEGSEYFIEFYEEYLYNFDSDDSFGQTDQSGMKWGLDGVPLSHKHDAIYFEWDNESLEFSSDLTSEEKGNILTNAVKKLDLGFEAKYDFYLSRDKTKYNLPEDTNYDDNITDGVIIRDYDGWDFNQDIIEYLKTKYATDPKAKLEGIKLNEKPESAIAYCYNRNKRDKDGNVFLNGNTGWYLPAIDEIEEIVKAEYASYFKEFQDNMYWSCQPSYIPYEMSFIRYRYWIGSWSTFMAGEEIDSKFYTDDISNARATKVLSENGEFGGIPDSSADIYKGWYDGKIYISASNVSKNKTAEIGTEQIANSNYNDITKHPGNLPRGNKARVRCVRKMTDNNNQ